MAYLAPMLRTGLRTPHALSSDYHLRTFLHAAQNHPNPANHKTILNIINNLNARSLKRYQQQLISLGYGSILDCRLTKLAKAGDTGRADPAHRRAYFQKRYLKKKAARLGITVEELISRTEKEKDPPPLAEPTSPLPNNEPDSSASENKVKPSFSKPTTALCILRRVQVRFAKTICKSALQNASEALPFTQDPSMHALDEALKVLTKRRESDDANYVRSKLAQRIEAYTLYQRQHPQRHR